MQLIESKPFYTPLFSFYTEDFATDMVPYIQQLRLETTGEKKSNVGGWHSPTYLEDDLDKTPHFVGELFLEIDKAVKMVYNRLGIIEKEPILSNYWYMINNKGDYNLSHVHSGSYISGVFYFQVPENSGSLRLYRPDNMRLIMEPDMLENNEYNYPYWEYNPVKNFGVLFPSTTEHGVMQSAADDSRIALAFNYK